MLKKPFLWVLSLIIAGLISILIFGLVVKTTILQTKIALNVTSEEDDETVLLITVPGPYEVLPEVETIVVEIGEGVNFNWSTKDQPNGCKILQPQSNEFTVEGKHTTFTFTVTTR